MIKTPFKPDDEKAEGTPQAVDSPEEEMSEGEGAPPGGGEPEEANEGEPGAEDSFIEEEGEQSNVSPQEQQAYDTVVGAALHQIWTDDQMHRTIVEKLKASTDNIAAGIGHTAAMILKSLSGGAEQQGRMVPDEVLLPAGQEVVAELLELSVALKLVPPNQAENVYRQAMLEGVKVFGQSRIAEGKVTANDMDGAAQELKSLAGPAPQPQQPPAPQQGIVRAAQGA